MNFGKTTSSSECVLSLQRKESMIEDIQRLWGSEISVWFKNPTKGRLSTFVVDNIGKEELDPREWSQQVIGWIQSLAGLVDLPRARQLLDARLFERWTAYSDAFDWEVSADDILAVHGAVQENPSVEYAQPRTTKCKAVDDGLVMSCFLDGQPLITESESKNARELTTVEKQMTEEVVRAMCRYMAACAAETYHSL